LNQQLERAAVPPSEPGQPEAAGDSGPVSERSPGDAADGAK